MSGTAAESGPGTTSGTAAESGPGTTPGTAAGSATTAGGSVERVRAALAAAGHPDTIIAFPDGTRTAADAAAAVGCDVAQIAKSIVFRAGERAAVIVTSGANRVDPARAGAALGVKLGRADPDWVRLTTGFAVGGVAPVGHLAPPLILLDEDLLVLDPVWAAAGSPRHVFRTTAADLLRMTGALVAAVTDLSSGGSRGTARRIRVRRRPTEPTPDGQFVNKTIGAQTVRPARNTNPHRH